MKDAYSFDTTQENAHAMYDRVVEAYHRIMTRFELPYAVAEADSGNIGGNKSHEFHALAEVRLCHSYLKPPKPISLN
jgi:prolyl-tRNA synthetase